MKTITTLLLLICPIAAADPTPEQARTVFERFKSMKGEWRSRSTAGWTETSVVDVIGKGSVVVERSHFDGELNDGMMSTIYLDGDRLLLTHYCEARNQPTLVASEISADGKHVVFTFLRASNLPSRDTGHMDSVVFDFIDDAHNRHRWSWFAKGKEKWFEVIDSEKVGIER